MKNKLTLTDKEYKEALKFEKMHIHNEESNGAIGGGLTLTLHTISIGHIVTVKCDICGEEMNITDFDSW